MKQTGQIVLVPFPIPFPTTKAHHNGTPERVYLGN